MCWRASFSYATLVEVSDWWYDEAETVSDPLWVSPETPTAHVMLQSTGNVPRHVLFLVPELFPFCIVMQSTDGMTRTSGPLGGPFATPQRIADVDGDGRVWVWVCYCIL